MLLAEILSRFSYLEETRESCILYCLLGKNKVGRKVCFFFFLRRITKSQLFSFFRKGVDMDAIRKVVFKYSMLATFFFSFICKTAPSSLLEQLTPCSLARRSKARTTPEVLGNQSHPITSARQHVLSIRNARWLRSGNDQHYRSRTPTLGGINCNSILPYCFIPASPPLPERYYQCYTPLRSPPPPAPPRRPLPESGRATLEEGAQGPEGPRAARPTLGHRHLAEKQRPPPLCRRCCSVAETSPVPRGPVLLRRPHRRRRRGEGRQVVPLECNSGGRPSPHPPCPLHSVLGWTLRRAPRPSPPSLASDPGPAGVQPPPGFCQPRGARACVCVCAGV